MRRPRWTLQNHSKGAIADQSENPGGTGCDGDGVDRAGGSFRSSSPAPYIYRVGDGELAKCAIRYRCFSGG